MHCGGLASHFAMFYFLAASWFDGVVSGLKDREATLRPWWGRDDWTKFLGLATLERRDEVVRRFRSELGYRYVLAWPIYNSEKSGSRVMYYMIRQPAKNGRRPRAQVSATHDDGQQGVCRYFLPAKNSLIFSPLNLAPSTIVWPTPVNISLNPGPA